MGRGTDEGFPGMKIRLIALATLTAGSVVACTDPPAPLTNPQPTPTVSGQAAASALVETRIAVPGQPGSLVYDHGSVWIGGSLLVKLEDDRIVQRLRTGVSRYSIVLSGDRLWATGGGDGGAPDGSVVAFDVKSGERVERLEFPDRSPYGIDAGAKDIFVALFQGDLLRITPHGNVISSIPLSDGLTEVLVAHGMVWVASPQSGKVWRVEVQSRLDTDPAATDFRSEPKRTCPQGLDSTKSAIWVADPCARKVRLLDPETGQMTDVLENVGRRPVDIDIAGRFAWIVSFTDNLVSVVDLDTFEVVAQARAGRRASRIVAHGREAWVANHEGYSLTHLELP